MSPLRLIPPPIWALLSLGAGYAASIIPGLRDLPPLQNTLAGILCISAGLAVIAIAMNQFRIARTELLPLSEKNSALVTSGVFGLTRNPMYLGMVLFTWGVAFLVGRAAMFAAPILMFAVANWVFIPFEEAKMRRQFGAAFDAYTKRVRRWF